MPPENIPQIIAPTGSNGKGSTPPPKSTTKAEPPQTWQFKDDVSAQDEADAGISMQWVASEFISHTKSVGWYLALAAGTLILTVFVYFLSKDFITPILIIITGILFGVVAARQPRELTYLINDQGVTIGEKFFPYNGFKSFSVVQEGGIESIWFMPLKRFNPSLTIYFAPDDTQTISEALSHYLPVESHQLDPIDRLMHRIGF